MPSEIGLVPVRFLRTWRAYYTHDVAGFTAEQAQTIVESGAAEYVDPDDVPAKPAGEEPIPAHDGDGDHDAAAGEDDADADAGDGDDDASDSDQTVEIPDGWEELHHTKRKMIASKIAGRAVTTSEEANEIIEAEIQRRAAA
jgi:hypothetical protein